VVSVGGGAVGVGSVTVPASWAGAARAAGGPDPRAADGATRTSATSEAAVQVSAVAVRRDMDGLDSDRWSRCDVVSPHRA